MSFGMLRWLAVLVALYQGELNVDTPVSLIGLEGPETAVHPGHTTAVLEALGEASLRTQVLATTQSASMLDYEDLDVAILRGVSRVKGRTIIGPVDAASRDILEEQLYTAGELLRMRHLLPDEPSDERPMRTFAAPA
jgi:predicted ATPase